MNQQLDMHLEMQRRKSQTQQMLEAFKEKGELTTADLMKIGTGCSSRLKELRREGHIIACTYEKPGMYRYTYLGVREDDEPNEMVID